MTLRGVFMRDAFTRDRWAQWRIGDARLTNTLLCVLAYALLMLARQYVSETDHFTIGFSGVAGWSVVVYAAAVIVVLTQPVNRWTLWIVLGWAIAMRAMVLFDEPFLSSDIYRYVWDGVVQHAGVNPYRYVPGDPALAWLRADNQDVFDNINRRDYARTIYPPVAQMVYWLATFFDPSVQAMKAAMFVFEAVTTAALIALLRWLGRSAADVLIYAWCPLLVWEIGASGHVDAAVYAFVVLALWCRAKQRDAWTGFFLGCAVMAKFYPLVLIPALWRRGDWKMPAALAGVCVTGYAVYASAGRLVFGFLGGYAQEEGMNSGERFFLLGVLHRVPGLHSIPVMAYMIVAALTLTAIAWWCWRFATPRRAVPGPAEQCSVPAFLRGATMLALVMMLLFSPHYPWYIAWLVPLMTLDTNLVVFAYVCAFFYGFTTQWAEPGPKMFVLNSWMYCAVAVAAGMAWLMRGRWQMLEARSRRELEATEMTA